MPEAPRPSRPEGPRWSWEPAPALAAAVIVVAAVALRLAWHRFLDPFEDGYQNWWISSVLVQTGRYADPYGGMTGGNWLPGYHLVGAAVIPLVGDHAVQVMKVANIVLSLGTTGVVFLLARPSGRAVAYIAATLFALSPADIVIASFGTPESITLLSTFTGVLLLERGAAGDRRHLFAASLCFSVAATMRYEAWGFVLFYLLWALGRRRLDFRGFAVAIGPALLFALAWLAWTSQSGFLPEIVFAQTSTDVRYKSSVGTLPPVEERLLTFFSWYLGWTPLAVIAIAWGMMRVRASALTWLLVLFYAGEVVYTAAGLGQPGPRYLHLTVPITCVFASLLLVRAGERLASRARGTIGNREGPGAGGRRRATSARPLRGLPVALALALSAVLAAQVTAPEPEPGTMLRGAERAGEFLRDLPLPPGRVLYSESPIAAYLSGFPASRMIGPASLPDEARAAEDFLVEQVAYVVMVTVPYHRLRTLFPDLADGTGAHHLRLLFDATGPEYDLGAPRVLVFEVAP